MAVLYCERANVRMIGVDRVVSRATATMRPTADRRTDRLTGRQIASF